MKIEKRDLKGKRLITKLKEMRDDDTGQFSEFVLIAAALIELLEKRNAA